MVDYEFQNEDTGKEMVKKLLRIWSIKKGKEKDAVREVFYALAASFL